MKLHELAPQPGSHKQKRRVGRGPGSGRGTYSGKGVKGQLSRSGHHGGPRRGFEGGQTPLIARMPKLHGFKNPNRVEYQVINLADLDQFDAGADVTKAELKKAGLIRDVKRPVKLLGNGKAAKSLTLHVDAASEAAKKAADTAKVKLVLPEKKERAAKKTA